MKIVVDMLGNDNGISAALDGIKLFLNEYKDIDIIAVGDSTYLSSIKDKVTIIDAKKALKMDTHSFDAILDKETSMFKAVKATLDNDADALVSSGSTGALFTIATLRIKKINNDIRPALISPVPTIINDKKTLLLDLGANSDNKKEDIISFIKMARTYYKVVYNKEPKFALLSNGSEENKGNKLVLETKEEIKRLNIPGFVGNVEGTDILLGKVDIIVTDGFTGNVALKSIEGTGNVVKILLKNTFKSSLKTKIAYLLVKKKLNQQMTMLSSKPLGGAVFIGLNKVVVKAHGNSDAIAFKNALITAYKAIKGDLINKIKEGINNER